MNNGVGILLAAGSSSRFGSDKRVASIGGAPMIERTLSLYIPVFDRTIVVVRSNEDNLSAIPDQCEIVESPFADKGISQSLIAGINAVECEAWTVVGLADMPFVKQRTLEMLRDAITLSPDRIVRLVYSGQNGNPVGLPAWIYPSIKKLEGDCGAQGLLHQFREQSIHVEVNDSGILRDVDTSEEIRS